MIGFLVVCGLAGVGLGAVLSGDFGTARDRLACDKAVKTIFETHDAVELERAHIIARSLRCGISRRIPNGY